MRQPEASRAAAKRILADFAPFMGHDYENERNTDRGPEKHVYVSTQSPFLRRRLVTEWETVAAALNAHGPQKTDKFIQEIIWRGYFKGWLEQRPQVWKDYCGGLHKDLAVLDTDSRLRSKLSAAEKGNTGLDYFDAWVRELLETGYLHNHARMWFASIWIFTLKLPWRLGADFFYRHLLDGDPASNTLGWRWVAGLHTRGKPYEAQASNIAKFTNYRFVPKASDLAQNVQGLEYLEPEGLPPVQPLRAFVPPDPDAPTALLLTEEDCCVEDCVGQLLNIRAVGSLTASHLRSPRAVSSDVITFEEDALKDTAERCGLLATQMSAGLPNGLVRWAKQAGAQQIVTPYVTTGPMRDWLEETRPTLIDSGIILAEWQRNWDRLIWPHATAGFFKVKRQIPYILRTEVRRPNEQFVPRAQ